MKGEESAVAASLIIRKLYSEVKIHYEILTVLIEQWVGTHIFLQLLFNCWSQQTFIFSRNRQK